MNSGLNASRYLTRYWFMYPGLLGFGVTAFSVDDAFFLLEAEGYLINKDTEIIADVDVSKLDRHVAPNAGPACFRGVWFPCLNIGWGEPGAHHPLCGGHMKAAPPFICQIHVATKDSPE
jgi:hypothetical protein